MARIHSKELSIASPAIYIDESINSVECKEIIEDDDKEDRKLILFIRRLWWHEDEDAWEFNGV